MTVQILIEGFALGASTGLLCIGSCVPFLLPYLMTSGKAATKENVSLLIQFFLGRFVAYFLFGMLAGWLGEKMEARLPGSVRSFALIAASLLMIVSAFYRTFPKNPFCGMKLGKQIMNLPPFWLGIFLGLNVCPPFLLGIARLMQIGSVWRGALYFMAFFVSSSLYLLPAFIVTPFFSGERARRLGAIVSLIVGGWFLISEIL